MQALASPALAAFGGPVRNRPPEQVQLQFPTQLELPPDELPELLPDELADVPHVGKQ